MRAKFGGLPLWGGDGMPRLIAVITGVVVGV